MLTFIRSAAVAATLFLVSAATIGTSPETGEIRATEAAAHASTMVPKAAAPKAVVFGAEFGLAAATAQTQESGLAVGQTAQDFRDWLRASPENQARLGEFRRYLAAQGVESVVPLWQLVRTSSSWSECDAEPFETPPADKWDHIVKTLQFVRDDVVPAVGKVEPLSAYRNEGLNSCSNGAPKSAHRHFFALDLTPLNKAVAREDMIRTVCAAHARDGRAYDTGLGFYSGRRFHVDSSGFRKWGPNGKGATSPCVGQA